ncbi:Hint domain-containing protein [Roseovarius aquimarinus]|uniref:Hint domain-containing protein n=1 Tax=Roseovarius aquimarinus TaxID=1229156 RepID=A0ABW7ID51_9RHOB
MPIYSLAIFAISNLQAAPGSTAIAPNETSGLPQVGDTFTVGNGTPQTIQIDDDNALFQDGSSLPQFIVDPLTIDGQTFAAGSQIQNEFVLSTNFNGVEIIAVRIRDAVTGTQTTIGYTVTGPIPPGTQVTISQTRDGSPSGDIPYTGVICFCEGTLITARRGLVPIEELEIGEDVLTLDHGFRPIRWIGSRHLSARDLAAHPRLLPVRVAAGALGKGIPEEDLTVSPQHRLLLRSKIAQTMFGTREVLVPAIKLCALDGIEQIGHAGGVSYWHVMLDIHEIIFANCAPAESLFAGPEALKSVLPGQLREIEELFPEATRPGFAVEPARVIPRKGRLMKQLVRRHAKHQRPLIT